MNDTLEPKLNILLDKKVKKNATQPAIKNFFNKGAMRMEMHVKLGPRKNKVSSGFSPLRILQQYNCCSYSTCGNRNFKCNTSIYNLLSSQQNVFRLDCQNKALNINRLLLLFSLSPGVGMYCAHGNKCQG